MGSDPGSPVDKGALDGGADAAPACSAMVIDDMEEEPNGPNLPPDNGGAFFWAMGLGNWSYDWRDDAAPEEIVPPRGDSKRARRLNAYATNELVCQLNHPSDLPVDLSGFAGITFWARQMGPGGTLVVTLHGKTYSPDEGPFAAEVAISHEWHAVDLRFADFRQVATAARPNPKEISYIIFTISGADAFDLWIDDLALLCPSSH